MRIVTASFTPGGAGGGFGGPSTGFAVAVLKARSAAVRLSMGRLAIRAVYQTKL
jgi:hypothetical protein